MSVRFDSSGRILLGQDFLPKSRAWSFNFGSVAAYANIYTDVIDLGEDHRYTFLIARKLGNVSSGSYIEIHSSIDGVRWAPAPGYDDWNLARRGGAGYFIFCVHGRPMGRYVRVYYKNGSRAQNELIIDLAAFAGI